MNEQEALARMVAPGTRRPGKFREGVIQIHVTRACDKSCFGCTQGSNLAGKLSFMPPELFAQAVESLRGYFGVVGVFGGNPAMSPFFIDYCDILRQSWAPKEQRGLWCNNLISEGKGWAARDTFNPAVSNLNVHLDAEAFATFKRWWPESMPFGLREDSRHAPPFVAMRDVLKTPLDWSKDGPMGSQYDEELAWELISNCDINQHWSAMIGLFRGELRAWFCEIAGAQAILHQDESEYPDTGTPVCFEDGSPIQGQKWWQLGMNWFAPQVRKHCHECGIPLRGRGELAQDESKDAKEQVSETHEGVFRPKRRDRRIELVTTQAQLGEHPRRSVIKYVERS